MNKDAELFAVVFIVGFVLLSNHFIMKPMGYDVVALGVEFIKGIF